MSDLRFAQFTDPQLFVEAVKDSDHSFFNFTLGSLLDSLDSEQTRLRKLTETSRLLFGVFKGEVLIITLTKIVDDFAWVLCSPLASQGELDTAKTAPAIYLLASTLPTVIDPKSLDAIIGHGDIVDIFLDLWRDELAKRGLNMKSLSAVPKSFTSRISYATLATIPPPSPAFSRHRIELATPNDVDELAHLYIGFTGVRDPNATSFDDAQSRMKIWVQFGQIWICRIEEDIAGYVATGRTTPLTVAIRNVYVSPNHRRKGVAEAMTRAVTRYMLGAHPLGFEGAPAGVSSVETKEQVCLNVAEEHVMRLYKRCGFLLGEDDRDPATGAKAWIRSCFRTIVLLEN